MAETSRGRVTITLGRSGQVVKRAASASDVSLGDPMPAVGTKRSVRDRLGRSNEDSHLINGSLFVGSSKRQRGDMGTLSSGADRFDDVHMDKDDLRLKLMRKNAIRRAHSNDNQKPKDLRDKLKKTARYPISTIESQRHVPETKEMGGGFGQMPSRRSADDLPKMDSHRNSYSPWPVDHFRRRSPDRVPVTSRGLSLQSVDEVRRRPSGKTFEDARSVPYMSKNVTDTTRPMTSVAFQPSAALSPGSLKPVASPHLGQVPPSSGVVSKSSYMVDEQQTVDGLLHSLGLGKYVVIFKAEEVDMTALKQMGENDLKELGIPMGPRKKILLALLPRSKRQP